MMSTKRVPPTDAPPAHRYVTRIYGRSLRPVVAAISLVTAIWALGMTVTLFKELHVADSEGFPKLAPLLIAQGSLYAAACAFQIFGIVAAGMHRPMMIRIYAFLCALSTLLVIGVGVMRVATHFAYKSDLINECIKVVESGSPADLVFGILDETTMDGNRDPVDAPQYCNYEWGHDSWVEIILLILEIVLGLLFTSIVFGYLRHSVDPSSPAYSSRLPTNQTRRDGYPTQYSPPYEGTEYAPVYLPPSGPPPFDGKPPEYKYGPYTGYGGDKDVKEDDPFSEFDGPSVPMPTHWVEDRDVTSAKRI